MDSSAKARGLFDVLRAQIREIDEDIIEIAEQNSVSYHGPTFFLEVLPREHRITLLLALDFNEIDDPAGIAQDATQWKFFVNAVHDGGVNIPVREAADIDKAMPMVHQAYAIASA